MPPKAYKAIFGKFFMVYVLVYYMLNILIKNIFNELSKVKVFKRLIDLIKLRQPYLNEKNFK